MKNFAFNIKKPLFWFYLISLSFVFTSSYLVVHSLADHFIFSIIPALLFIAFLALFSLENLTLLIVFCTPLAVTLKDMGFSSSTLDLSIPTEPLMAGVMLLFILNQLHNGIINRKLFTHPITICIGLQLFWTLITSLTSEIPLISIKFLVARLWFICTSYLICSFIFRDKKNIFRFLWLYIVPLILIIFYTLYGQSKHGFDEKSADWIMTPFYNDHTAYAAVIAMYIPVVVGFLFQKSYSFPFKIVISLIFALFITATIYSYTRAAWLSLAVALAVLISLLLKVKFKYILFSAITLGLVFFIFQAQIIMLLQKNNSDSDGGLQENLQSIGNIKTDPSNVERLNRWDCAFKMFKEKPVFGWGPGTYMFKYAPFQSHELKTIISTNAGTNGNSHSEYLGPLSEQGVLGLICFLAIILSVYFTGFRLCYTLQNKELKFIVFSVLLGLTTYFVHGMLNNFLDTDKAAVPFWGFIAVILSIDVFHNNKNNTKPEKNI